MGSRSSLPGRCQLGSALQLVKIASQKIRPLYARGHRMDYTNRFRKMVQPSRELCRSLTTSNWLEEPCRGTEREDRGRERAFTSRLGKVSPNGSLRLAGGLASVCLLGENMVGILAAALERAGVVEAAEIWREEDGLGLAGGNRNTFPRIS